MTETDDEKVEQVVTLIRKLIVKKGRLDDEIQKLNPSSGSTIQDQRWNAYLDLGFYMNCIATEEGRLLSSHHLHLFHRIKDKDKTEAVGYIARLLSNMKGEERSLEGTQVNNVKNYNFNLKLSLTLGDSEILNVVGSTMKWVISSLPKILDKMAGLPIFLRRCQNFFTGTSAPSSSTSAPSSVLTSPINAGICIFHAWCTWKGTKSKSKSKAMLDFVLPLAEHNLKQLEVAPDSQAYISELMFAAFIVIVGKGHGAQNGNNIDADIGDPQALAEAYTLLDSKEGDPLELIKSRLRRLSMDYHPDRMIGKSPEEIEFGRETFDKLFDAFKLIQRQYNCGSEIEKSYSKTGSFAHITDTDTTVIS